MSLHTFAGKVFMPDESSYICWKGFHAINVQTVADPDLRFINVVVKLPESTHDSSLLSNSNIAEDLCRQARGYLLGDTGYPLKTWLMTPFLHAIEIHQRAIIQLIPEHGI